MRAQTRSVTLILRLTPLAGRSARRRKAGAEARQERRLVDWRREMLGRAKKARRSRPRVWREWRRSRSRRGCLGGRLIGWMATETPSVRSTARLGKTNMRSAARNHTGAVLAGPFSCEMRRRAEARDVAARRVWGRRWSGLVVTTS